MNPMTPTLILAMIVSVGLACARSPQKSEDAEPELPVTACAEPRPEACTLEFIPVCGHRYGGRRKTYPNACSACADSEVAGRHPGACEEPDSETDEPPESESTE